MTSWLDAVTAAPTRTITPQTAYVPNAAQTLPDAAVKAKAEPAAPAAKAAKAAPAAKSGGTGAFKEYLHVRGADGKFITKGAIVNVTGPDGKPKRGRIQELTPDGPTVRYDDGTIEQVPLADATSRITPAPKAIARITQAAGRSQMAELPYDEAQKWNDWQRQVLSRFDKDDGCTQDAAEVIRTGQIPSGAEGGCIGPADGVTALFLQRIHREGAAALNQGSIGDDERAIGVLGAKLLGYMTTVRSGPKPKAAPKPKVVKAKAAPKAKKPKKAKKVKWSPWG